MKISKLQVLFLCMGLILLSSCKKTYPPQLKAVPSNASFVVGLENLKIIQKGGLDNLNDYKFYQKIQDELAKEKPAVRDFFNKLLKDPKATGLDVKQSYIYGAKNNNHLYVACIFKINDPADFEKFLKELHQVNENFNSQIEDKGTYKLVNQDDEIAYAWNKELLFLIGGNLNGLDYAALFTLPKEKSITSVEDFVAFQKKSYDIGIWTSYTQFMELYQEFLKIQMPSSYNDMFAGTYMHGYVNFENGEIKVTGNMSPKSKVDEFYAKYPIINTNFNHALLNDFPESSYLCVKFSVNWKEYMKLFNDISGAIAEDSLQQQMIQQMITENPTTKQVLDALGGDILFSLYGFAQGPLPLPLMGISFTVNSKEDFEKLMALVPEGVIQPAGTYYSIQSGGSVSILMAYKDNRVLITDDTESITAFTGKGLPKTLNNSAIADQIKKSPGLFYLNLDLDTYPANIRNLLNSEAPESAKKVVSYLQPYKEISYGASDKYEFYLSIKFKDQSQNSLKIFLKSLDGIADEQFR